MSHFNTSMVVRRQMNIGKLLSEGIIHKLKSSHRKIILSDEGNEAQYLVFISAKLVFHFFSSDRLLLLGSILSFSFFCYSNKSFFSPLSMLISLSLNKSEFKTLPVK